MTTCQYFTTNPNIIKLFDEFEQIETPSQRDIRFLFRQKNMHESYPHHYDMSIDFLISYMNKYYHREIDFILENKNILAFGTKSILNVKSSNGYITLISSKFNYSPSSDYNRLDYSTLPLFNMFQTKNSQLFDEFEQKIISTLHKYLVFQELNMPITSEMGKLENVLKIIIAGYLPKFYVE